MPKLSLVVATVGRTTELARLFASLITQSFRDFEVIVVDQNTDERLLPCIRQAQGAGLPLIHIKHFPANLSSARNAGIEQARGAWIGFPDDDCWYDPALLERLLPRFECTEAMSGATVRWIEGGDPAQPAPQLSWARSRMFRDVPVTSFTLFFNRKLFERIGGFDPRLGVGLWFGAGEETDLVLRALRAGAVMTYEPQAEVHHPVKPPLPDPSGRIAARYRARGAGALYVKHRLPPWVIVRGLTAPVLRPLLRGSVGDDMAHGIAVMRGRLDGLLGWEHR